MPSDYAQRASLQVAPLSLERTKSSFLTDDPARTLHHDHLYQMTPPHTPDTSQEDLSPDHDDDFSTGPVFTNFLRAVYPFHPTTAMTDSTVTLPLNEGDVVLVHSIHTNGWADGSLLLTGARGWLPTNYCDAYEPEDMHNLLKALLLFWDLLRSTSVNDREIFGNQEFMKGLIAGVRFLLERSNCLNRDAPTVQRSEVLRKARKSLLSELSALVKTAKRLQEGQHHGHRSTETVNDIVDEMILKAFRIVTKAVRFVDVLEEDRRLRAPASVTVMATVVEETPVPPTPPADRVAFGAQTRETASDVDSKAAADDMALSVATSDASDPHIPIPTFSKRISSLNSSYHMNAQRLSTNGNRLSTGISHRVSLAGPSPLSRAQHLVSERLNRNHDTFLSHLGSFIGRLHLQSQSLPELSLATKQSALSGGQLLAVVDAICAHNLTNRDLLTLCRATVFERISDLVFAAKDTLLKTLAEETGLIMPNDNAKLLTSATACVRAAGECVAKAKTAVERTGDFEFDDDRCPLDIDLGVLDVNTHESSPALVAPVAEQCGASVASSNRRSDSSTASQRRPTVVVVDKPLPEVPQPAKDDLVVSEQADHTTSQASSRQLSSTEENVAIKAPSRQSGRSTLPPLPQLTTTSLPDAEPSTGEQSAVHEHDFHASSRYDSVSAGSSATYPSRDSEASMASQTSTRATTPDHTLAPRNQPSLSELSAAGSSVHGEDVDEFESRLMEKTYVHELMFNKEGQVTGGSLPALVERLTTHESTPDAMFVSTFYLTFRLFCTPRELAENLIDRFEYVGDSPHMAAPVRLRVYNAFKGWLESHWRHETDAEALDIITSFATGRLSTCLPSVARRLLELVQRVAAAGNSGSRLVSSMGKTNTSMAQYVPTDSPIPASTLSKGQASLLSSFKSDGSDPSIVDFDPLEIARQLTLKQMGIFCAILPEELLGGIWMKNGGVDAPNVKAMSGFSTDLSNMVSGTILHHHEMKKRAAVIKQWIKIAQQCFELNNYDGLMAIICSLNNSVISRLKKTWDMISTKRKEVLRNLQVLVEPNQNHKVLRTRLHDQVTPCLPFVGMYLTDLTFVDIGNPPTKQMTHGNEADEDSSSGLTVINFDKHTRTAKIIGDLQRFQIPYRLQEIPDFQDWMTVQTQRFRETDHSNQQVTFYRKSLLLEPRETNRSIPDPPPTPTVITPAAGSKTDLFGWMTRDRSGTSTQI